MEKKIIFSGIQPTGTFTLGNYLGAIKNWDKLQDEYNCIYSIVNLHAITVWQDPSALRRKTLEAYALLLACGIDTEKSTVFIQSHNRYHAELNWLLSCSTQFGELNRMTQFKDKSSKNSDNINAGLFTYPVLMAADILAYNSDLVPVGADQKQHLELARNIAQRFNQKYGEFFTVPEPYIPEIGARIMSLQDPLQKMSKSDPNPNGCVFILDDRDAVIRKFKRAITDSETTICYREGKDGINNLMMIYSSVTGKSLSEIQTEFDGRGYGEFKISVGEAVAEHLRPIREKYKELIADKSYLEQCYRSGAERATKISRKIVSKAYRKSGLL